MYYLMQNKIIYHQMDIISLTIDSINDESEYNIEDRQFFSLTKF